MFVLSLGCSELVPTKHGTMCTNSVSCYHVLNELVYCPCRLHPFFSPTVLPVENEAWWCRFDAAAPKLGIHRDIWGDEMGLPESSQKAGKPGGRCNEAGRCNVVLVCTKVSPLFFFRVFQSFLFSLFAPPFARSAISYYAV